MAGSEMRTRLAGASAVSACARCLPMTVKWPRAGGLFRCFRPARLVGHGGRRAEGDELTGHDTRASRDVRTHMVTTSPEAAGPGRRGREGLLEGDARGVGRLAHRRGEGEGTRPLTRGCGRGTMGAG